ncbi:hypothetical protein BJX68DRAFT_98181 [Aspergillus pseudodeflectus]|uniref:Uncharacterized protein n=1 Tax=Aspergillus pseudodeflectus TaxID=176178 RepID=A0ABR4KCM3_9EURO
MGNIYMRHPAPVKDRQVNKKKTFLSQQNQPSAKQRKTSMGLVSPRADHAAKSCSSLGTFARALHESINNEVCLL